MTQIPKWNDTRTAELASYVGDETPVSQETVAAAAEQLETTPPVSYTHLTLPTILLV